MRWVVKVREMCSRQEEGSETCGRFKVGNPSLLIFIKGTWHPPSHFTLLITDCHLAWTLNASEQLVEDRASAWDETTNEYILRAQRYLSHQQDDCTYSFVSDGENRKLSWTTEKHGTKLEAKWKCLKATNVQQTICDIMDFLMGANIKLSNELVRKRMAFDKMKMEAEKCLRQSEAIKDEKIQFEEDIYKKFVVVLNSKKDKLRELRDRLLSYEPARHEKQSEEEESETEDGSESSNSKDDMSDKERNEAEPSTVRVKNKDAITHDINTNKHKGKQGIIADKTGITKGDGTDSNPKPLFENQSKISDEPLESAADLLNESTYSGVPKRRRRLLK